MGLRVRDAAGNEAYFTVPDQKVRIVTGLNGDGPVLEVAYPNHVEIIVDPDKEVLLEGPGESSDAP